MKTWLFIFLLPLGIFAQNLAPQSPLRFLALGDSYTIGQSVANIDRWPQQLSDSLVARGFLTDTLSYIATTGWRTDDLLSAINGNKLVDKNYNLVSLLIGVNNQYQAKPFSQYVAEFPALLDSAIRYAGGNNSYVFVVSIPDYAFTPFGQQSNNQAQISAQIDQYNQYNKRVTDSMNVTYFDITPISRQGLQNTNYVAGDGLHPSGVQYAQWVKLMLNKIDQNINTSLPIPSAGPGIEVKIFPNPVVNNLTVSVPGSSKIYNIQVYNSTGQLLSTQSCLNASCDVNLLGINEGLLNIKVNLENGYQLKKIIRSGN